MPRKTSSTGSSGKGATISRDPMLGCGGYVCAGGCAAAAAREGERALICSGRAQRRLADYGGDQIGHRGGRHVEVGGRADAADVAGDAQSSSRNLCTSLARPHKPLCLRRLPSPASLGARGTCRDYDLTGSNRDELTRSAHAQPALGGAHPASNSHGRPSMACGRDATRAHAQLRMESIHSSYTSSTTLTATIHTQEIGNTSGPDSGRPIS